MQLLMFRRFQVGTAAIPRFRTFQLYAYTSLRLLPLGTRPVAQR